MLIALPLLAIPVLLYTLIVIFGMDGGFTAAGADARSGTRCSPFP
ncbi:hypothetical protein [Brevundimonas denitrificans]